MMKRIITVFLSIFLAVSMFTAASAQMFITNSKVHDNAGILTSEEEQLLGIRIGKQPKSYEYDIVVVTEYTVDDLQRYAERFYDDGDYKDNGVLLLYCVHNNESYIDVVGGCQAAIGDTELDKMFDGMAVFINEGLFGDAFGTFVDRCGVYLESYITTNGSLPEIEDNDFGFDIDFELAWYHLLIIAVVVGAVVGFISVGVMKSKLRSVKSNDRANSYVMRDTMRVTLSREIFLYRNVVRTARPKSNSSGRGGFGGGSRHRGGGRRF